MLRRLTDRCSEIQTSEVFKTSEVFFLRHKPSLQSRWHNGMMPGIQGYPDNQDKCVNEIISSLLKGDE